MILLLVEEKKEILGVGRLNQNFTERVCEWEQVCSFCSVLLAKDVVGKLFFLLSKSVKLQTRVVKQSMQ